MNRAILADEKMLELSPHGSREFPFILQRIVLSGYPAGTLQCHRHPEIEMIYILSGSMLFQINHHYLDVKEGDCLFINAGVLHGASIIGEQDCTYLCIDFHPDLIGGPEDSFFAASFVLPLIQSGTFSHTVMNRTHPSHPRISDSFRQLERLCREAERGYQLLIRSRLFEIWHIILHAEVYVLLAFQLCVRVQNHRDVQPVALGKSDIHDLAHIAMPLILLAHADQTDKDIRLFRLIHFRPQILAALLGEREKMDDLAQAHRAERTLRA